MVTSIETELSGLIGVFLECQKKTGAILGIYSCIDIRHLRDQAKFAAKKKKTWRERFLAEMEQVVPWSRLLKALSPYYYPASRGKRGRPPISLKRILRMYFVQQWYARAECGMLARRHDRRRHHYCRTAIYEEPGQGTGSGDAPN
ncbi:tis1021-transposase protein [Marinobacter sp. ELB17]|nr:tis1021-transposase protein [Marinobacter sp. ELB17]